MRGAPTGKISKKTEPRTDWRRLRSLTDAQVHAAVTRDPDINPTDEAFWTKAEILMPRHKKTVTMRLDADILEWFRSNRGYQTRINAILRAYMNATSPAPRGTRSGKGHPHHSGK
jgi:uncharacterized protein (DUF4415 family)